MGQNQPAIFQQGEPLSNYDVIQKVPQHNISYLKHKTSNKEYLIRQFAINDKTQFSQTCEKIKNRKKLQSQHLTKLQRYSQQMEDNLCSSFYKIFAMWQYPTHTLSDEINERALKKRRFQQNEIFSITASVIQGMSCLQASGIKHQCLTTNSILFDQTGTVIVADPLTSVCPSNFDRINTNRKTKNVYISPQQCQSLKNQRPIPNRNPYKSDVFILGLILLQCGLLEKLDTVFVQDFEQIDLEEVDIKLNEFTKYYSQDLRLTVETMLTRDPKERMDWLGLKQYIPEKNNTTEQNKNNVVVQKQETKQPLGYQQFNKLTLGGERFEHVSSNYNRQQLIGITFNKFEENYNYGKGYAQNQNFNHQPFAQKVQTYQPISNYTVSNLPLMSSTSFGITSTNPYTPLTTTTPYGTQKVSEYIFEGKMPSERPTTEIQPGKNISKITPLIDRDSSSFPLNSNFQFKKDYLNTHNFPSSSFGLDYQPIHNYPTPKDVYHSTLSHYNTQPTPVYKPPQSAQGLIKLQSNIHKSYYNNDIRTQVNSQLQGSPFLSTHVKDAKSITYDKNIYNSHIAEDKSHIKTIQNVQTQPPHYSTMVMSSQQNDNGFSPNSFYQPITKTKTIEQDGSKYLIASNPVLYQPLGGQGSVIKQKPNINPQILSTQLNYQQQNIENTNSQFQRQSSMYQNNQTNQVNQNTIYPSQKKEQQNQQLEYVIQHFRQGSRYEGTKFQDLRHGQGKFFYQDGGMYQGNWKLNKMDGYGKLYYQSGKIAYEGNWSQDQFQGFGKLYNEDPDQLQDPFDYENFDLIDEYWTYYEGNFVADEKDGEGKMVFSNGQYFVGSFHQDMIEGPGEFHRMNGEVVKGIWNQNQLVEEEQ